MEKIKELYEKVAKDSALQAKFAEIMKESAEAAEATRQKLNAFAKEAGYDVTLEDMLAFFKDLAEKKEGVLSDMELDAVAGGKSDNLAVSILIPLICMVDSFLGKDGKCKTEPVVR
jgi:predicted ribosomally synthesized peptide with nif11-like leader